MFTTYMIVSASVTSSCLKRIRLYKHCRDDGTDLTALVTEKCRMEAKNTFIVQIIEVNLVLITTSNTKKFT